MRLRRHPGFTLIELVIVIAIIGILAVMVMPKFNDVTEQAKINTFEQNCKTIISSIGIYQASHEGDLPSDAAGLGAGINGGWEKLTNSPQGANYDYTGGVFNATYTDSKGTTYTYHYPN